MFKTKAELQTELRQLMRGGPGRLPISSMPKHQLEAHIDAVKKMKGMAEEKAKEIGWAKLGPPPSRQIPTATVEVDGEETITVPGQPPARMTKPVPVNKPRKPKAPAPESEEAPESPVKPTKSIKTVSIKEESARPLKEKSVAKVFCTCNCPSCPHK